MTQAHPVPDVHARDSLPVENVTCSTVALLGAREGTNQIQLRAGIDHPADAAQHSIHFAERAESIDVNGRKARGLQDQFRVVHMHPRNKHVASLRVFYVGNLTRGQRNHALASSRFFARGQWSKLNSTATCIEFVGSRADEAATVGILPHLPAAVAATISINSIPDIARA